MIVGPNGPVALSMQAVDSSMDLFKVPDDERMVFSLNVRAIAAHIIEALASKN